MRRLLLLAAVCFVCTCGEEEPSVLMEGGIATADAGSPDGPVDAAQATTVSSCLDRPDELPRPPTEGLPCDLIPPGLTL